jgi:hypothetical protein
MISIAPDGDPDLHNLVLSADPSEWPTAICFFAFPAVLGVGGTEIAFDLTFTRPYRGDDPRAGASVCLTQGCHIPLQGYGGPDHVKWEMDHVSGVLPTGSARRDRFSFLPHAASKSL